MEVATLEQAWQDPAICAISVVAVGVALRRMTLRLNDATMHPKGADREDIPCEV